MDFTLQGLEPGSVEELHDRAVLDGREYDGLPPGRVGLRDASVLECRFVGVTSAEVDLCGATLRETELERPDLTVVEAWRGRWNDVRVRGGRLGVLQAYDASWTSVEIHGCKLSYVNLRGSEVTDLVLRDCHVEELDLGDATLRRVSLEGSRLTRLTARGARMREVDLRGARFDAIDGVSDLRGAIVSTAQLGELAPLLAESLGITVDG